MQTVFLSFAFIFLYKMGLCKMYSWQVLTIQHRCINYDYSDSLQIFYKCFPKYQCNLLVKRLLNKSNRITFIVNTSEMFTFQVNI